MKNRVLPLFLILVLLAGCSSKTDKDETIATVNGEPVYLKEFKREWANKVKQNPSLEINKNTLYDLADTLVKRKLLIQEAMKKKIPQEERFADTIKAFWEQTLIRDFVEYKNTEFDRYIFVTDKEIKDYYEDLKKENPNLPPFEDAHTVIKERIEQKKKTQALEVWLNDKRKISKIYIDKKSISKLVAE